MPSVQDNTKIGLIGPNYAGKSSIFSTFHEALDQGRHGFPRASNPHIRRTAEATPVEGLLPADILLDFVHGGRDQAFEKETDAALGGNVQATSPEHIYRRHYSLSYYDIDECQQKTVQLTITDAAGEHSFPKKLQNGVALETRRQLFEELSVCDGLVVVVPFSEAAGVSFVRQLEKWLSGLDKIAATQEKPGPVSSPRQRRVVIALTRYDALFTDFGSDAFKLAADPKIATAIINDLVRAETRGIGYRNNIAGFDISADGRFEIAFVPTSSFGFVPGFGCANLDPNVEREDAIAQIATSGSPRPFEVEFPLYLGQRLFPFLTADPFIFAATGIRNPFIVPLDLALHQVAYTDQPKRASPAPPRKEEVGAANSGVLGPEEIFDGKGDGPNASGDRQGVERDSLRRRIARFLRSWDLDL
jgi:hypothetical protein